MTEIPSTFVPLPVPLPPMLLEMAGVKIESQFVALNYQGSKATWSDGRSSAPFPFFTVWQPYIEHLAIAIYLLGYNLGSDDALPEQALVCDRLHQKVYVAQWDETERFLDYQHPKIQALNCEQWQEIKAQIAALPPPNMSQLQELAMFEMFLPPLPQQAEKAKQLVRWLDQYIDEALLRKYIDAANAGDFRALMHLRSFMQNRNATKLEVNY